MNRYHGQNRQWQLFAVVHAFNKKVMCKLEMELGVNIVSFLNNK